MRNRVYSNHDSDGARHCNETCSQAVFHKGSKLYDYLVSIENRIAALERGGSSNNGSNTDSGNGSNTGGNNSGGSTDTPSTPSGSTTDYTSKLFSISGDSISTFKNVSTGASHYNTDGSATSITDSDQILGSYTNTWWMKLINGVNATLGTNASYSGASVAGWASSENIWEDATEKTGCSPERINRLCAPKSGYTGTAGNPDYIICFFGANDWGKGATLGTYDGSSELSWPATTKTTEVDFSVGLGMMISRTKEKYPNARIVLCTMYNLSMSWAYPSSFVSAVDSKGNTCEKNRGGNGYTIEEFNNRTKLIAQNLGLGIIDFYDAWTYENRLTYIPENVHPNKDGMEKLGQIAVQAMQNMTWQ